MYNFIDITIKKDAETFLNNLDNKSLLIYSEESIKKINFNNKNVKKVNWHDISKDITKINLILNTYNDVEQIIGFGGGSTIDIAKYISYKLNIKYICIPTMLSTNSYATNKVALIDNNNKITFDAKTPDSIILDSELLKKSVTYNLYGIADILSIKTALCDWKIAFEDIGEKIDEDIYNKSMKLLNDVIYFISNNTLEEISNDIEKLFEYIGISGEITNIYGSGRPESGSEHIFAKSIETKLKIPHGIAVSFGIILMTIMQENEVDEIINIIKKINVLENSGLYGVNSSIIEETLINLLPREDRYSIINRFYKNNDYKLEKLKIFYDKVIIKGE